MLDNTGSHSSATLVELCSTCLLVRVFWCPIFRRGHNRARNVFSVATSPDLRLVRSSIDTVLWHEVPFVERDSAEPSGQRHLPLYSQSAQLPNRLLLAKLDLVRLQVCAHTPGSCAHTHARWHPPPPPVKSGNRYQIVMSSRHARVLSNRYNRRYTALAVCQADTPHRYRIVIFFSGTKPSLLKKSAVVNPRYQIVIIERMFERNL